MGFEIFKNITGRTVHAISTCTGDLLVDLYKLIRLILTSHKHQHPYLCYTTGAGACTRSQPGDEGIFYDEVYLEAN